MIVYIIYNLVNLEISNKKTVPGKAQVIPSCSRGSALSGVSVLLGERFAQYSVSLKKSKKIFVAVGIPPYGAPCR